MVDRPIYETQAGIPGRLSFMRMNISLSGKEVIGFCTEPFSDPTGSGYNWTLTTLLGSFLREAELRYGPRDRNWTPLGIEFCGNVPQIWYPGDCQHVSIMLTESARKEPARAIFQLAHEVVHLLAPLSKKGAVVFEEGLATLFSHDMCRQYGITITSNGIAYLEAEALIRQFIAISPDGVRKIRLEKPSFNEFTPEIISRICPETPRDLALKLCEPFGSGLG